MDLSKTFVMVKGVNAQKNFVLELIKITSNTSYEFTKLIPRYKLQLT